jgi:hypothetical protein
MPDAGFDASVQLLLALNGLLHSVAAFLVLLSSYVALSLFVVLCIAAADLVYRTATRISTQSANTALRARTAVAHFEWRHKATQA